MRLFYFTPDMTVGLLFYKFSHSDTKLGEKKKNLTSKLSMGIFNFIIYIIKVHGEEER